MKPLETVGRVTTRDGRDLVLYHRDGTFQIRLDGLELMSSRAHGSEAALAELALDAIPHAAAPKVLVGGLGMGFTLRAALDAFPRAASFTVAEVFPEVVAWNRGPLAHLASEPLEDPRVELLETDVARVLGPARRDAGRRGAGRWDAILLDVDNGPAPFTLDSNARLYSVEGLGRIRRSLTAGGVLAVWCSDVEPAFERRLRRAGFRARRERVPACGADGGPPHTIYLAKRHR